MWNQVGNLDAQGFVWFACFCFFLLKALLGFSPSLLPFLPLSLCFVREGAGEGGGGGLGAPNLKALGFQGKRNNQAGRCGFSVHFFR